jgi:hypothetical protein
MQKKYAVSVLVIASLILAAALLLPKYDQDNLKLPASAPTRATDTATSLTPKNVNNATRSTKHVTVRKNNDYTLSGIITLNGAHDLTICHKIIAGGYNPCIRLENCYNIRITLNKLWHSKKPALVLYNCRNILVDHNFFNDVATGVYAEKSETGGVKIDYNQFLNMQGPYPRGQFVQFNDINGAGNSISYNKGENIAGQSNPEDAISLFKSNGTAKSPVLIKGNWIRGGGPGKTGGGIMLGDNGGSYLTAIDNTLVDPGQYGIAISGGDNNSIIRNLIYARSQSFTNVGIYVAGFGGANCTNSTVAFNKVHYLNNANVENDFWIGPHAEKPLKWETNLWGAKIGSVILPAKIFSPK